MRLYFRAPQSRATVELRPSAPTTSRARSSVVAVSSRYAHAGHAAGVLDQPRDLRRHAHLGARLLRGLGEDRVEHDRGESRRFRRCRRLAAARSHWMRKSSARLSRRRTNGAPVARSRSVSPSRARKASASASKRWVDRVSRGNRACSTTTTLAPSRREEGGQRRARAARSHDHDIGRIRSCGSSFSRTARWTPPRVGRLSSLIGRSPQQTSLDRAQSATTRICSWCHHPSGRRGGRPECLWHPFLGVARTRSETQAGTRFARDAEPHP